MEKLELKNISDEKLMMLALIAIMKTTMGGVILLVQFALRQ